MNADQPEKATLTQNTRDPNSPTITNLNPALTPAEAEKPETVVQGAVDAARAAAQSAEHEIVPGYKLLEELGRGAGGVVHKARHLKLNRLVALKISLSEFSDEKSRIRFLAEAAVVASVRHSNVVQVYDYGENGSRPYMALEYCSGGSLADRLRNATSVDVRKAIETVQRIAAGVAAAHEQSIVHRDLKPSNILLDENGEPKVADFGLAKRSTSDLTATQAVMGTPSYMSPEQAGGKTKFVGPQADVWALGVILYECLTNERPFPGDTNHEVLARVLAAEPAPLRMLKPDLPHDLDLICRKCMERNPADRYMGARELADDLAKFLRGEPISVREPGRLERLTKWAWRNPTRAVAYSLVGVMVALAMFTVGVILLWRDAEQRGVQAEQKRQQAEIDRNRETEQRTQDLLREVSAAEAEAVDRLRTGRFRQAQDTLTAIIPRLRDDPKLESRLTELERRLTQAKQLESFYTYANRVWVRAWDDDRNSEELLLEGQRVLESVGVLTPDGKFPNREWWKNLPDRDLGDEQSKRLRVEVYQQLMILVTPYFREAVRPLVKRYEQGGALGLFRGGPIPESTVLLNRTLELLDQAQAWEQSQGVPPTRLVVLLRRGTNELLSVTGGEVKKVDTPANTAKTTEVIPSIAASEYYFFGLLYHNLSQYPNTPTMKLVTLLSKGEIQANDPEEVKRLAEENLRNATRLDPNRLWPNFVLGSALLARNDFGGAEIVFSNCLRIEPRDARSYIFRAKAIVGRALALNNAKDASSQRLRKELVDRALADRDAAVQLDPLMSDVYFSGAELFATIEDTPRLIAEVLQYLVVEDRTVNARLLRRQWFPDLEKFLRAAMQKEPNNAEIHAVLALLKFRQENALDDALKTAEDCLKLQPNHPLALTVRGMVRFQRKEWDKGRADFENAKSHTSNYFTHLGYALSLEQAGEHERALAEFDRLLATAKPGELTPKWQLAELHHGKSRVLAKLNHTDEANAAQAKAREIDSRAVKFLEANMNPKP